MAGVQRGRRKGGGGIEGLAGSGREDEDEDARGQGAEQSDFGMEFLSLGGQTILTTGLRTMGGVTGVVSSKRLNKHFLHNLEHPSQCEAVFLMQGILQLAHKEH